MTLKCFLAETRAAPADRVRQAMALAVADLGLRSDGQHRAVPASSFSTFYRTVLRRLNELNGLGDSAPRPSSISNPPEDCHHCQDQLALVRT